MILYGNPAMGIKQKAEIFELSKTFTRTYGFE